jgi:hypothetical protein
LPDARVGQFRSENVIWIDAVRVHALLAGREAQNLDGDAV